MRIYEVTQESKEIIKRMVSLLHDVRMTESGSSYSELSEILDQYESSDDPGFVRQVERFRLALKYYTISLLLRKYDT